MTKGELLERLAPFTDEAEIRVRIGFSEGNLDSLVWRWIKGDDAAHLVLISGEER